MKTAVVITLALLAIIPVESKPQKNQPPSSQSFAAFWTTFKAAVAKDDKAAVAAMTQFPFLYESEERTKDEFIKKIYNELFDKKVKRCFATRKPLNEDDAFVIFCGEINFYFRQVDGEYKLIEFGADD
jgi:hypothetical protein